MTRKGWFGAGWVLLIAAAGGLAADSVQKSDTVKAAAEDVISTMNYAMASPRAFLMGVPVEGAEEMAMIGAAENFPRTDGILEIPTNTRVIFSLSQETEGVWQPGTYGTIETSLAVQWFQSVAEDECEVCASVGLHEDENVQTGKGSDSAEVPCPWITIATAGARDTRTGPSLGYTKVGVPIEFTEPGTYCVRGVVSTSVRSSYLRSTQAQDPTTKEETAGESSDALLAIDTDVVLVRVRVLDQLAPDTKPQGALTADPEVVYTAPMPSLSDTKVSPNEDTKKDSGAISQSSSPGVFLESQEVKYAIPL